MQAGKQLIGGILLAVFMGNAHAATTFTASGYAASDGRPENARADFVFDGTFTNLRVTLTNTAGIGQLGGISSVLDGIGFSLSGVSFGALTLNTSFAAGTFNPNGTVTCDATSCVTNATPVSLVTAGWGYNSGDGLLAAGNGSSFKPYGIVNGNLDNTDGIKNSPHNPYLMGPVTFDFAIANPGHVAVDVASANFYFGTAPDMQAGIPAIPEPEAYALILVGLGLVGLAARRRSDRWAIY